MPNFIQRQSRLRFYDSQMGDVWEDGDGTITTGGGGGATPITIRVPVSNNGNAPYWWDAVTSLVSQGISAFGGAHTGTQVVSSGNRVTAITNPVPVNGQPGYAGGAGDPAYQAYLVNRSSSGGIGNDLGTGLQGLLNTALNNPVYLIGGALALYLLFRQPPGSKK